ncbi:DUF2513 domain-containing protein [Bacillus cereus]|jgi:predicted transcriptional regulator|nr:DUF2513 domain-containing protein [Bacillus thuringiensis]MRB84233.1 DUF2513 domain-containing protein [Bacillus thuringiensis]PES65976.1 DUF2513 domain-containing protein [Bacillus cereus]PGX10245.1 DUF2513 domain-containing protein [Bacillus cereus]
MYKYGELNLKGELQMKRDMELVRKLLVLIEEQDDNSKELNIPSEIDRKVAVYHLNLLEQAGFTENKIFYADNAPMWIHSTLTWDGHEFLDAIKNDTVWKKLKQTIAEKGGNIPFEIMKALAIKTATTVFLG